jgi:hypothetical protein
MSKDSATKPEEVFDILMPETRQTDKVVSGREPTFGDLGVHPRPLEEFLAALKDKYS